LLPGRPVSAKREESSDFLAGWEAGSKLDFKEAAMNPSPYAERSDEDLLEAYCGCDDLAFAELYRRYHSAVVALLRRSVSQEDAEDLAEETFLRLVRTKTTGQARFNRTSSSFRTWLYTVARHLLQDHPARASCCGSPMSCS
jgi:hypothetical protein